MIKKHPNFHGQFFFFPQTPFFVGGITHDFYVKFQTKRIKLKI